MSPSGDLQDRARELGRERIEIAATLRSREDWDAKWPAPRSPFPFSLAHWKHCMVYTVEDYAAEVGFLIDIVGLRATMFGPDDALLTGPQGEFAFQVVGAGEGQEPTPPETIALLFYVDNLEEACATLASRGVAFTEPPAPRGGPESTFYSAEFRTPHGVSVSLWGVVDPAKRVSAGS